MFRTRFHKSLLEWLVIAGVVFGLCGLLAHAVQKVSAAANQHRLATRSR
jgi:hypothetical protein